VTTRIDAILIAKRVEWCGSHDGGETERQCRRENRGG
jgi:hypothetical protein